jgi:hypothetical protein
MTDYFKGFLSKKKNNNNHTKKTEYKQNFEMHVPGEDEEVEDSGEETSGEEKKV